MYRKFEFKGKTFFLFPQVYYPAEDSFLLAENLIVGENDRVLDIGTGCGLQAIMAAKISKHVVATDINPYAIENTKYNAHLNNIKIETRLGDLFEPIKEKFDLIIFNPPYLPSESNSDSFEEKAWNGGLEGRLILDRFLGQFCNYLNPNGRIQLVQSSLTNIDQTLNKLKALNFNTDVIAQKKFFFEKLVVINAQK